MKKYTSLYIEEFNKHASDDSSGIGRWLALHAMQNQGALEQPVKATAMGIGKNVIDAAASSTGSIPLSALTSMTTAAGQKAMLNNYTVEDGKDGLMKMHEDAKSRKGHFGSSFMHGVSSYPALMYALSSAGGGILGGALGLALSKGNATNGLIGAAAGATLVPTSIALGRGTNSAINEAVLARVSDATANRAADEMISHPSRLAVPFGTIYGARNS